ncbi:MAG TPA: class II aldolase/adducin family protein [Acidimicrobiales bacterium]|nr:class II aldolase/adducin family protein [Acidimicrobiales bacterium]
MTSLAGEVSQACRILGERGLGDMIWGHASARDPDGRGVWLKGSGLGFDEVTASDVVLVDAAGTRLEGSAPVHIEFPIHTEIMAARPDVNSVVHCHPAHCIAFAATGEPLLPISHEGTLFAPPGPARFTDTADLISTPGLGRSLAAALGSGNALLIPGHGMVAVGADLATAVMTAVLLERACELQLMAMAAGGVKFWSSDEEALAKRAHCWGPKQISGGYEYLRRRAAVSRPGAGDR